jgi:hypothetical protein
VQLASVDAVADLTAGQEFPIASWTDAYNDTVSNLQSLEAQMTADPHPILSAIDANMTEYANELSSAAQTSSSNLTNTLQDLSSVLRTRGATCSPATCMTRKRASGRPCSRTDEREPTVRERLLRDHSVDGEQPRQRAQP